MNVGAKADRFPDPQGIPGMDAPFKLDVSADVEATRKALSNVKLKDVVQDCQEIVMLEHNMTVTQMLRLLAKHMILSAPLVVKPGIEDLEQSFPPVNGTPSLLGWLDVSDILRDFLQQVRHHHPQLPTNVLQLLKILEEEGHTFGSKTLITLMDSHDSQLLSQPDADTSLLTAITQMFLNPGGGRRIVHRLALFDALGDIEAVVSHLDVLRHLQHHSYLLASMGDKTLLDLGLLPPAAKPVQVEAHTPTLLAYEALLREGVRGAAVVGDGGALVANLSISDLRSIQPEHLGVLALPVAEFLAVLHGTAYLGYSQRTSHSAAHPFFGHPGGAEGMSTLHKPVTATATTTISQLIQLMTQHHVHRVFVMSPNSSRHVEAVVTPTDIMAALCGVALPRRQ